MRTSNPPFNCKEKYSWYNGSMSVTGQNFDIEAQGVAYGNGYFIAVCKNARIYRSANGIKWEDISPPAYDSTRHFFGIGYDPVHKVWVAAGRNGMIIKSVDDGMNWMTAYTTGSGDDLLFVAYGKSVLLVISEGGRVYRSTDGGDSWDNYMWNPITQRPRSITFARGIFVAGGYNGAVSYSSNGSTWTRVSSGSEMRIRGIAYSPGLDLWVAGGKEVCTSKDLDHWTHQFNIEEEFGLRDQVYCGVGGQNFALLAGEHSLILASGDPTGKAWSLREAGSGGFILGMANHPNGSLVVNVGNTVYKRNPAYKWHYPFRYNQERCINPNISPLYVMKGNTVVKKIEADYLPLAGNSELRAEVHLRKDSRGRLWASLHYYGLYYSTDSGKTWSFKPNDLVTKDKVAYSYFTILEDDTFLLGKVVDGWVKTKERTPILFYRSEDYGDSWQEVGSIHAAPFEAISEGTQNLTQLADGTILYAVTRYDWVPDPEEPDGKRENAIFRSFDGGFNWGDGSDTYSQGLDRYVWEPHIIQLQSGKLLGAFRYQRRVQDTDTEAEVTGKGGSWSCGAGKRNSSIFNQIYIGESYDNGYTWVNLHDIRDPNGNLLLFWGDAHGTLLQVPDGRVVLVYDHRYEMGPGCTKQNKQRVSNRAVVSGDEGDTWGPEIYHLSYGKGYPSSVALDDGTIVTVTGNDLEDAKPFTAMAVRWTLLPGRGSSSVRPAINVTSPRGGENWDVGSPHHIRWAGIGTVGKVEIAYSIDNGASWIEIISAAPNTGKYEWTVPDTPSANCLVRVRETDGQPSGISSAKFSIVSPSSITITSPKGGENWKTGSPQHITWDSSGTVGSVAIEYSDNNGLSWQEIISSTADVGKYEWTVPAAPSGNCLVRVRARDGAASDRSPAAFSIVSPAKLSINRTRLDFGAKDQGTQTGAQAVTITNTGEKPLNWTAAADAGWLKCSPTSGVNSGVVSVSIEPRDLPAGEYKGKVTVSDPNAEDSPQTISVTLKVYPAQEDIIPFGSFDAPKDNAVVSGGVPITGWAMDKIEVESVKVYRKPVTGEGADLIYIGEALLVEDARPDVMQAHPDYPNNYRAGWGYMLLTNTLPDRGNGLFRLVVKAKNSSGHEVILGEKSIKSNNADAVKPFGTIDMPAPNGIASGSHYRIQGWVLTPQPNKIPEDGSTIKVFIDGAFVGHAKYNVHRPDIESIFPGYANSKGALAYFDIDTTKYSNGRHRLEWSAADSAGNSAGLGSRFFIIKN